MAGITMENEQYSPGTMVDGGKVRFDWDTYVDCAPNPLPPSFDWTIKFIKADGTYWEHEILGTTPIDQGNGYGHAGVWWTPPEDIPPGGIRPEWFLIAVCGMLIKASCTGITMIPGDLPHLAHDGDKIIQGGYGCPLA